MKTEEIKNLFDKFESIACEYDGVECWSARELCRLLGYAKWERFEGVIARAKEACENAGVNPSDHFPSAGKMIELAKGAQREVTDASRQKQLLNNAILRPHNPQEAA